jgi:hypothetical protein
MVLIGYSYSHEHESTLSKFKTWNGVLSWFIKGDSKRYFLNLSWRGSNNSIYVNTQFDKIYLEISNPSRWKICSYLYIGRESDYFLTIVFATKFAEADKTSVFFIIP